MSDFAPNAISPVSPTPRCTMMVRAGVAGDFPFLDRLQKMHSHMVGWMPRIQLEQHIAGGHVLIAEGTNKEPLGYCIFKDQYLKRDDVGIIYQLNVLPLTQRNLIGATLVKETFHRAAYGCKLFSCWCAQDIQANYFWEAMGFLPLAFRTGSRAKQRIHIFWQRRIREHDQSTPYWFPSATSGGAVAEDRLVLPIPPGTLWRDAKPVLLPELPARSHGPEQTLPGGKPIRPRPAQPKLSRAERAVMMRANSTSLKGVPMGKKVVITKSGFKYIDRTDFVPDEEMEKLLNPKKLEPKPPRAVNDPKYIAAARELRDRYLEQMNSGLLLPGAAAKYDVARQLEAAPTNLTNVPLLKAA